LETESCYSCHKRVVFLGKWRAGYQRLNFVSLGIIKTILKESSNPRICRSHRGDGYDIIYYSPLKISRLFGGTCRLHFQSRRISQARNQYEAGSKQSLIGVKSSCNYL
jgi:hypothetical protein